MNHTPVVSYRLNELLCPRTAWNAFMRRFGAALFLASILFGMGAALAATVPGAIPGSFGVSETGAATYSIPIAVPPGTAGMEPKLSINYSSQGGDGIAGTGWSVSGLSAISRCPSTIAQDGLNRGVQYDVKDKFCLDGQRLIAVNGTYGADGTEYRTEIESFTRVISHGTTTTGPQWFEAWTKSGQHIEYGNTATSATSNVTVAALTTGGVTPTIVWAIDKISDTVGNYITFTYLDEPSNGQFYPQEIDYTGNAAAGLSPHNKVTFSYVARASNPPAVYLNGYKSQLTQRLTTITTYAGATQARTYNLGYSSSGDFMISVQECDGTGNCVNPTTFAWQLPSGSGDFESTQPTISGTDFTTAWFASSGDVNGDGYDDLLTVVNGGDGQSHLLLRTATGDANVFNTPVDVGITTPLRNCAIAANCAENQEWPNQLAAAVVSVLGDVNGDGLADLILGDGRVALGQANGTFGTPYAANVQIGPAPFAVVKDVNGDGLADLVYGVAQSDSLTHYYIQYAQANGTFANPVQIATAPLVLLYTAGTYNSVSTINEPCAATLGDVNGDGRADLITCTGHVYQAIDNNSFTDARGWGQLDQPSYNYDQVPGTNPVPGFMSSGDINGDGLSDVLSGTFVLQGFSELSSDTVKSDGYGFGTPTVQTTTLGAYFSSPTNCFPVPYSGLVAGNFTGRGQADALEFNYAGSCGIQSNPTATLLRALVTNSPVITTITDGLGASRSITYSQLNDSTVYTASTGSAYPVRDLPPTASSLNLVSSTSADNGIGGSFVLNYQYAGGKADAHGRGFLGFNTITVTDPLSGIVSTTTYAQAFPYIGQLQSQTKTVVNGTTTVTLSSVINSFISLAIPANPAAGTTPSSTCPASVCVQYPYVSIAYSFSSDLNGTALPYTLTFTSNIDWYGNIGTVTVNTSDSYGKTTTSTYSNDATHWILGRLTQSQVASSIPNGSGGTSTQTRTSAFQYDATSGLLTQETIEPGQPQYRLDTAYAYDAFGNRTSVTVSSPATGTAAIATRSASTTWDANGQFPLSAANALGHTESKTFDPRFGTVANLTGPNGLTTTWQYDGFGRKTRETRADGTQTVWTYDVCDAACPANGVYRIVTQVFAAGVQSAPVSVAYFDSLNREVRSATQGFDGTWIYKDTIYDEQGRVQKVSRSYFVGQTVYWVTSEYDDLSRVVRVYEPDAPDTPVLSVDYNGLTISRTNRKGQITTEVRNSQGQKISVTDAMGNITTYAYDPFGNLIRTTDPAGNQIVNLYDLRGRKTQTSDPDLGLWKYEYDVLGELVKQTDAKNQISTMAYDTLGRMTSRAEPGLTSTWTYDGSAYGKGKLQSAQTSLGYIRTHYYDDKGRSYLTLFNLGAGEPFLWSSTAFDAAGRVAQQTYPSNFSVKNVYNAYGYLAEVRNANTNALFWRADQMDAAGHITKETYGNGVVTDRSYAADTGRLQNIVANTAGGQQIQGQAYVYDTIGNVAIYADGPGNQLEIRGGYDAINRLTQIDSTIDGVASSQTLVYDALGNITSKTGVGNYAYGDPLHKHAVTAVTGGPANLGYGYDANGNLVSGAGRSLAWTAWNMPANLTQGGQTQSWLYDTEHNRYKLTAPGRTTWYLNPSVYQGGHYERTLYSSGTVEHRHTLYGGGRAIGEVLTFEVTSGTAPAAQTRYFHSDQQGSIAAVTDSAGVVLTRFRYDAWGKQTLVSGSNTGIDQTRQGHTAHEMLDGGLTHMNGRLYDPVLSRFVSADPYIQSPYDLQSFNRYSYVFNNPMGNTDPSGYFSWKHFLNPFASKTSFIRNVLPGWEYRNNPYVKMAGTIVAAYFVGPAAYNFGFWGAGGAALGAGASAGTATFIGGVAGGALAGAAVGGIAGGIYNGPQGILQGAQYGAIGGAITGPVAAFYGDGPWSAGRLAAQSVSGGISSAAQGGRFGDGFRNSFATGSAAWLYTSTVYANTAGEAANPMPGQGLARTDGTYDPLPDGRISAADLIRNVTGRNDALDLTGSGWHQFWVNLDKQGGFLSNVMNAIPGINATGALHDTWWNPKYGNPSTMFGFGFNPVTNWGTMLPAAAITYGALLDNTYAGQAVVLDRIRK